MGRSGGCRGPHEVVAPVPSCPGTVEPLQPGLELWVMPGHPQQVPRPLQSASVAPAWPRSTPPHSPRDREARTAGLGGLREGAQQPHRTPGPEWQGQN